MSTSIWSYTNLISKYLTSALTAGHDKLTTSEINRLMLSAKLGVAMSAAHFCYAIGTQDDKTIVVTHKYQFVNGGTSHFMAMVVDERGTHYVVNNSLWFWKWDSLEDWHALRMRNCNCKRCLYIIFSNMYMYC